MEVAVDQAGLAGGPAPLRRYVDNGRALTATAVGPGPEGASLRPPLPCDERGQRGGEDDGPPRI
jgi:hypothetical protein